MDWFATFFEQAYTSTSNMAHGLFSRPGSNVPVLENALPEYEQTCALFIPGCNCALGETPRSYPLRAGQSSQANPVTDLPDMHPPFFFQYYSPYGPIPPIRNPPRPYVYRSAEDLLDNPWDPCARPDFDDSPEPSPGLSALDSPAEGARPAMEEELAPRDEEIISVSDEANEEERQSGIEDVISVSDDEANEEEFATRDEEIISVSDDNANEEELLTRDEEIISVSDDAANEEERQSEVEDVVSVYSEEVSDEESGSEDEQELGSEDEEVTSMYSDETNQSTSGTLTVVPGASQASNIGEDNNNHPELEGSVGYKSLPEPTSCFCGKPDYLETMIACGSVPHSGEGLCGEEAWFHLSCAGLDTEPKEDDPWFCAQCEREVESQSILRRKTDGSKRLPGAPSPSPESHFQKDGDVPRRQTKEQDPRHRSNTQNRKRKAESSEPERPQKKHASNARRDTMSFDMFTSSNPHQAKRKADNSELERMQTKHASEARRDAPFLSTLTSSYPRQSKRKADSSEPERPHKKHASEARHEPPSFNTFTSPTPRQAKRKAADPDYETPHKKHKIATDGRGSKVPQRTAPKGAVPAPPARSRGKAWTRAEEEATIEIMADLIKRGELGEGKWMACAEALEKEHGFGRTSSAIKTQWNRVLRARTGLDERGRPNPDKMVTGALTPRRERRGVHVLHSSSLPPDVKEEDEGEEEEKRKDGSRSNLDVASRKRKLRGGTEY